MPKSERGRLSAKRKRESVLRLLRGEDPEPPGSGGWAVRPCTFIGLAGKRGVRQLVGGARRVPAPTKSWWSTSAPSSPRPRSMGRATAKPGPVFGMLGSGHPATGYAG